MATTSLNELQSYTGDAALGFSGNAPVGVYDFKNTMDAVDRLTAYTVQKKRDEWVQNNKEIHEQAMVAADQFNFTYGDLLDNDKAEVDKSVADLTSWFQDHPTSAKYMVRPDGTTNAADYKEFINKRRQLDFLIKRGNMRAAQTQAVEKQLSTFDDPKEYQFGVKWLQDSQKTPITKNILTVPASEQFNLADNMTKAVKNNAFQFQAVKVVGDDNFSSTFKLTDLNAVTLDLLKDRHSAQDAQEHSQELNDQIGKVKSQLLPQFTKADGSVDEQGLHDAMMNTMRSDPNLNSFVAAQNVYNAYADHYNSAVPISGDVKKGKAIRDAKGNVIGFQKQVGTDIRTFYQNGMRTPLPQVNIFDGITPEEYIRMGAADKTGATMIEAKVDNTNRSYKYANLSQDERKMNMQNNIEKQKLGLEGRKLDIEQAKIDAIAKAGSGGGKGGPNYGEPSTDIYQRLQNGQPVTQQELALAAGDEIDPDSKEYKLRGKGIIVVNPDKTVTIDGKLITPGQIQYNLNAQNNRLSSGTKEDPYKLGSTKLYDNSLQGGDTDVYTATKGDGTSADYSLKTLKENYPEDKILQMIKLGVIKKK